jgi:hypothetical protein
MKRLNAQEKKNLIIYGPVAEQGIWKIKCDQ